MTRNRDYTSCDIQSILRFILVHHVNSAPSVSRWLVGGPSLVLLGRSALMTLVGRICPCFDSAIGATIPIPHDRGRQGVGDVGNYVSDVRSSYGGGTS